MSACVSRAQSASESVPYSSCAFVGLCPKLQNINDSRELSRCYRAEDAQKSRKGHDRGVPCKYYQVRDWRTTTRSPITSLSHTPCKMQKTARPRPRLPLPLPLPSPPPAAASLSESPLAPVRSVALLEPFFSARKKCFGAAMNCFAPRTVAFQKTS